MLSFLSLKVTTKTRWEEKRQQNFPFWGTEVVQVSIQSSAVTSKAFSISFYVQRM